MNLPAVRPIGKWERLARERQERDLKTASERGFVFDPVEAERAVSFFSKYLRHHKGEWAGKPLILAAWQAANVGQMFGWRRLDNGFRRFRSAWWEVPRKNGKTQIAAGVGLKCLVQDGETGGEVYTVATKRDQALICHRAAARMVMRSPDLARFVKVPKSFDRGGTLVCERLESRMEPLSADYNTLDGLSPSATIRDEVHEWKDQGLASVLDTATGARRQPLDLEITTAGVYNAEAIGWQHHDHATKILEQTYEDDSSFAFITSSDEDDDPFDPATWWKANPNLGISPKLDYIAKQADKARRQPSFLNDFLRYHLNTWTQQVTRWLSMERWNECDGRPFNPEEHRKQACWGGLDLSTKLDLTAFALVFKRPDEGIDVLCRFWIPENTVIEQAKRGRRFYEQWVRDGWITATPGDVIDYEFIRAEVNELSKQYEIQQIAYDPWNATDIATRLSGDGLVMVETRQGYKTLSEPSKDLEARITARKVRHGGNPVLRWNVANAVISRDAAGNIKPDKEKASDKIDGVVAAIMALSRAVTDETDGSFYETRGL